MKNHSSNLENTLGYIVGRASRALANRFNQNLENAGYDVTCEQFSVLNNLWKRDGQTQKELADCTCKDKTSITRLIDGMAKRHLVVRVHDKKDARKNFVFVTNKGKMLRIKMVRQINKTLKQAKSRVAEKDLRICKNVLLKVVENLT